MTETERGWHIVKYGDDPRYYLRCKSCEKTLVIYNETTAKQCVSSKRQSGQITADGCQSSFECPECLSSVVILLADVYEETPYRAPPSAFDLMAHEMKSQQMRPIRALTEIIADLIKTAQTHAKQDLKVKNRSATYAEPEFWTWFIRHVNTQATPPFFESHYDALAEWRKHCNLPSSSVMLSKIDAVSLLRSFERALREMKSNPSSASYTLFFDAWLATIDKPPLTMI